MAQFRLQLQSELENSGGARCGLLFWAVIAVRRNHQLCAHGAAAGGGEALVAVMSGVSANGGGELGREA